MTFNGPFAHLRTFHGQARDERATQYLREGHVNILPSQKDLARKLEIVHDALTRRVRTMYLKKHPIVSGRKIVIIKGGVTDQVDALKLVRAVEEYLK